MFLLVYILHRVTSMGRSLLVAVAAGTDKLTFHYDTKHQLKTIQKIEHNLAYMDYAMIFCL